MELAERTVWLFAGIVACLLAALSVPGAVSSGRFALRRVSRKAGAAVVAAAVVVALTPVMTKAVTPPSPIRLFAGSGAEESDEARIGDRDIFVPIPIHVQDHHHVVVRGESLSKIAAAELRAAGRTATGRETARLWRAIYAVNEKVIGNDPNLIRPGQVLTVPRISTAGVSHG